MSSPGTSLFGPATTITSSQFSGSTLYCHAHIKAPAAHEVAGSRMTRDAHLCDMDRYDACGGATAGRGEPGEADREPS